MLQGLITEHFIYSISNLRVLLYRIRKILAIRMTYLSQVSADIMRNTRDHRHELTTLERFVIRDLRYRSLRGGSLSHKGHFADFIRSFIYNHNVSTGAAQ